MKPDVGNAPDSADVAAAARRCAIYGRTAVGSKTDPDLAALNLQRVMCAAYVRYRLGGRLIAAYEDPGFPGVGLERPALQLLLRDIDARKLDAVVVLQLDRLSRSLPELAQLMMRFDQAGVSLITVTGNAVGGQLGRRRGRR
jgi:site-specific DNA recombinase